MTTQNFNQGIAAIQQGNTAEGERLLLVALQHEALTPQVQAIGYMWLAETRPDMAYKLQCYQRAAQLDPTNPTVQQRLQILQSQAGPAQQAPGAPASQSAAGREPMPLTDQDNADVAVGRDAIDKKAADEFGRAQSPEFQQQQTYAQQQQAPAQQQKPPPPQQTPAPQQQKPPPPQHIPARQQPQGQPGAALQRSVGVLGGPNGPGTGFFVSRNGLLATTHYVVGDATDIDIALADDQRLPGRVVRAFPTYDLAFVYVQVDVPRLPAVSTAATLPPDTPLVAIVHPGRGVQTSVRESMHDVPAHWFPTVVNSLPDAGGNPVYETQGNTLVGMMTKVLRRTNGFFHGLYISQIQACLQQYINELRQLGNRAGYCNHCGRLSQAASYNSPYCEHCGGKLPDAPDAARQFQPQLAQLYGEGQQPACSNCSAAVGYYQGRCLRCGADTGTT